MGGSKPPREDDSSANVHHFNVSVMKAVNVPRTNIYIHQPVKNSALLCPRHWTLTGHVAEYSPKDFQMIYNYNILREKKKTTVYEVLKVLEEPATTAGAFVESE